MEEKNSSFSVTFKEAQGFYEGKAAFDSRWLQRKVSLFSSTELFKERAERGWLAPKFLVEQDKFVENLSLTASLSSRNFHLFEAIEVELLDLQKVVKEKSAALKKQMWNSSSASAKDWLNTKDWEKSAFAYGKQLKQLLEALKTAGKNLRYVTGGDEAQKRGAKWQEATLQEACSLIEQEMKWIEEGLLAFKGTRALVEPLCLAKLREQLTEELCNGSPLEEKLSFPGRELFALFQDLRREKPKRENLKRFPRLVKELQEASGLEKKHVELFVSEYSAPKIEEVKCAIQARLKSGELLEKGGAGLSKGYSLLTKEFLKQQQLHLEAYLLDKGLESLLHGEKQPKLPLPLALSVPDYPFSKKELSKYSLLSEKDRVDYPALVLGEEGNFSKVLVEINRIGFELKPSMEESGFFLLSGEGSKPLDLILKRAAVEEEFFSPLTKEEVDRLLSSVSKGSLKDGEKGQWDLACGKLFGLLEESAGEALAPSFKEALKALFQSCPELFSLLLENSAVVLKFRQMRREGISSGELSELFLQDFKMEALLDYIPRLSMEAPELIGQFNSLLFHLLERALATNVQVFTDMLPLCYCATEAALREAGCSKALRNVMSDERIGALVSDSESSPWQRALATLGFGARGNSYFKQRSSFEMTEGREELEGGKRVFQKGVWKLAVALGGSAIEVAVPLDLTSYEKSSYQEMEPLFKRIERICDMNSDAYQKELKTRSREAADDIREQSTEAIDRALFYAGEKEVPEGIEELSGEVKRLESLYRMSEERLGEEFLLKYGRQLAIKLKEPAMREAYRALLEKGEEGPVLEWLG